MTVRRDSRSVLRSAAVLCMFAAAARVVCAGGTGADDGTDVGDHALDREGPASVAALERALRSQEERNSRLQEYLARTQTMLREERLIRTETAMRERFDGGEDGPSLAWSLNDAGLLMAAEGRLEAAQILFERALRILGAHLPESHPARGTVLQHLGDVLLQRQDPDAAKFYSEAALVFTAAGGPDHPRLAAVLNALALALGGQGRIEEAEALYRRAIRIYEEQKPDPQELAGPLHNLAVLLLGSSGRTAEAGPLLERALGILRRHRADATLRALPVMRALARYEFASGNAEKALRYEQKADSLATAQLEHSIRGER